MKHNASKIVIREVSTDSTRAIQAIPACMCSNTATNAEVTLADIHRLSKHLNLSMESVYDTYCIPIFESETHTPHFVTLKPVNAQGKCVFEVAGQCSLGEAKPTACRIAPLLRAFVPVRNDAWRVAYFVLEENTPGTKTETVAHLLDTADAAASEDAYGHLHTAYSEVYKRCAQLVDLTGEVVDPLFMSTAVRRLLTEWDEEKSLVANAVQNRTNFREAVWSLVEPRIAEILGTR